MLKDSHETVENLLNEMKPILLLSGCNPAHVRVALGDFKLKTYNVAYDWLHRIYLSPEYAAAKSLYVRIPAHAWEMYAAMGTEGLWEQDEMLRVGAALKELWRDKKPRLFGRDKPDPPEQYPEEEETQEEE